MPASGEPLARELELTCEACGFMFTYTYITGFTPRYCRDCAQLRRNWSKAKYKRIVPSSTAPPALVERLDTSAAIYLAALLHARGALWYGKVAEAKAVIDAALAREPWHPPIPEQRTPLD